MDTIRVHDIRHSYATRALQMGVDIATLKELLGHSTLVMALRYSHYTTQHLKQTVDKLFSK